MIRARLPGTVAYIQGNGPISVPLQTARRPSRVALPSPVIKTTTQARSKRPPPRPLQRLPLVHLESGTAQAPMVVTTPMLHPLPLEQQERLRPLKDMTRSHQTVIYLRCPSTIVKRPVYLTPIPNRYPPSTTPCRLIYGRAYNSLLHDRPPQLAPLLFPLSVAITTSTAHRSPLIPCSQSSSHLHTMTFANPVVGAGVHTLAPPAGILLCIQAACLPQVIATPVSRIRSSRRTTLASIFTIQTQI